MDDRCHFVLRYMESSDGRCTEIEYYCGEWIFAPHGDLYTLETKMIWGFYTSGARELYGKDGDGGRGPSNFVHLIRRKKMCDACVEGVMRFLGITKRDLVFSLIRSGE